MLDTYANLQLSVIDFSHRSDLDSRIPDFIRLAEDKVYAFLESSYQDVKTNLTTVASQEYIAFPADYVEMRSLGLTNNTAQTTLDYVTPDQMNDQYSSTQTGQPRVYTIINNSAYMRPIPDTAYTLPIVYMARLAALSVSNTTNWLLTNYPLIYLYATLEQLAMFIKEDPSFYESEWQRVAGGINAKDAPQSANMQVRTDVNLSRGR